MVAKIAVKTTKTIASDKSVKSSKLDAPLSAQEMAEAQKLAYQYFAERGYTHGHHLQDWAKAESVVKSRRK